MKKTIIRKSFFYIIAIIVMMLMSGCTTQNGPTVAYLLHGKMTYAKLTKNLSKISKKKKIYVLDITDKSYDMYDPSYSYIFGVNPEEICAPGDEIKSVFKKDGYKIVNKLKDADFIIISENLGCGQYGLIKNNLKTPKNLSKIIDNNFKSEDIQNISSLSVLSSSLSTHGYSAASKATAALALASLFGNSNPDNYAFSADAITIIDTKKQKAENSILYTYANSGKTNKEILKNCNKNIVNLLANEVEPVNAFGAF